jgi:hypothetical protein
MQCTGVIHRRGQKEKFLWKSGRERKGKNVTVPPGTFRHMGLTGSGSWSSPEKESVTVSGICRREKSRRDRARSNQRTGEREIAGEQSSNGIDFYGPSKIPVCSSPILHLKDMDDQDLVVDRDEGSHIPADPDRVYRVTGMRSFDLFDKPVGLGTDVMDLPDNLAGNFRR